MLVCYSLKLKPVGCRKTLQRGKALYKKVQSYVKVDPQNVSRLKSSTPFENEQKLLGISSALSYSRICINMY